MKKIKKFLKKIFNKKTIIPIVIVIALIIISIIIYLLYKNETPEDIVYEDYTIYSDLMGKVEEYDSSMTVDGYEPSGKAYYVIGKISSKEDKDFSVITFNLYDKDDKLLGTAIAGLNELKKGKTYDFKALGIIDGTDVEKVDYYTLEKVELG